MRVQLMMGFVFQYANLTYMIIYIMLFTFSGPNRSNGVAPAAPQPYRSTQVRPASMYKIMTTKSTGCGSCGGR